MEFESPDVQKDFPGLYASESGRKSNESDYSDDGHEKLSKKDLLIGKRKDKKDSKKDRGYAALEGESSPEEDPEIKSPSKSKKSKSFKFPSKKEKREKSRDKDIKEKDKELEKKKEKEAKAKLKLKERKKSKHGDDSFDIAEELPIFGVSLELAVQRNRCHDGVDIPLIVRDCIDYVEEQCMNMENIYKLSGIKSKVQTLKRLYNQRDTVRLNDYEPPVITSLIKLFLRELPESILTQELSARFEEAAAAKEVRTRESELNTLVNQLPRYNKQLLGWLMVHLDNLTSYEKLNKMNAQNVAIELSPILQMSHRLLAALLCHCRSLFPNIVIKKYIPPLTAGVGMPENESNIQQELAKQESLLSQIHMEMNAGLVSKSKEEQLWEVQRIITQLKRKLRTVQRAREMSQAQKSLEEDKTQTQSSSMEDEFRLDLTLQKALSEEDGSIAIVAQPLPAKVSPVTPELPKKSVDTVDMPVPVVNSNIQIPETSPILEEEILPSTSKQEEDFTEIAHVGSNNMRTGIAIDTPEEWQGLLQEEAVLQLEHRELLCLQADLQGRVQEERNEIERLRTELATARAKCNYRSLEEDSSDGSSSSHSDISESEDDPVRKASILELKRENQMLQSTRMFSQRSFSLDLEDSHDSLEKSLKFDKYEENVFTPTIPEYNICPIHKPVYVSTIHIELNENSISSNDVYYSKCHIKPCECFVRKSFLNQNEKNKKSFFNNNNTNIWRDRNLTFEQKLNHLRELNKRNPNASRVPFLNTTPTLTRKFDQNQNQTKSFGTPPLLARRNSDLADYERN